MGFRLARSPLLTLPGIPGSFSATTSAARKPVRMALSESTAALWPRVMALARMAPGAAVSLLQETHVMRDHAPSFSAVQSWRGMTGSADASGGVPHWLFKASTARWHTGPARMFHSSATVLGASQVKASEADAVEAIVTMLSVGCNIERLPRTDWPQAGEDQCVPMNYTCGSSDYGLGSRILGSKSAHAAIIGYMGKSIINRVPVEPRRAAKAIFRREAESLDFRTTSTDRIALLCNAGFGGSGKSTLQAFNMLWFVQLVGGVPIEVTFNDDQSRMFPGQQMVSSPDVFMQAVAVRVLHRALSFRVGNSKARSCLKIYLDQLLAALDSSGGHTLNLALDAALEIIGASKDSRIMLAVDELALAPTEAGMMSPARLMSLLTGFVDENRHVHLSISAYGCLDLATSFLTTSSRAIRLQPLPPIFPIFTSDSVEWDASKLPALLQPFLDAKLRQRLPYGADSVKLYATLSRLLLMTGGNPRAVAQVLQKLDSEGSRLWDGNPTSYPGALRKWLEACASPVPMEWMYPMRSSASVSDAYVNFEALAKNAVVPFPFPKSKNAAANVAPFLDATVSGYCSYLPVGSEWEGVAFFPLPVLLDNRDSLEESGPRGAALSLLTDGLNEYSQVGLQAGKGLEKVVCGALLTYLRGMGSICIPKLSRCTGLSFSVPERAKLKCRKVIHLHSTGATSSVSRNSQLSQKWASSFFPLDPDEFVSGSLVDNVAQLVDELKKDPQTDCLVLHPEHEFNIGADVFCLFRRSDEEYVLLVIQCKDWFKDKLGSGDKEKYIVDDWRRGQLLLGYASKEKARAAKEKAPVVKGESDIGHPGLLAAADAILNDKHPVPLAFERHGITPVFMLFSSNPLSSTVELRDNEAVTDLQLMEQWMPTAALNAQAAHRLRQIFTRTPSLGQPPDEESN